MTHRIVATAPTSYQSRSLSHFNLNTKKNGNGSITGIMDFYSEEDAKDFLVNRAELYYENEEQLNEALDDIERCGILSLDTVTARIIELDQAEEEKW